MSSTGKKKDGQSKTPTHQWTVEFLRHEFDNESDRAAVILVASLLDETLANLLKNYFVAIPNSSDSLFDNATAPLSTFSSKIDMAFRLGLISNKLCRDMHLIRKIRNSFAHDIYNCDFENGSVKSQVDELYKSAIALNQENDSPARVKFLYISCGIIWMLNAVIKLVKPLHIRQVEPIYVEHKKTETK